MSKQLLHMKRQVASKMGGRKAHGLTCPHCHGYRTTKEGAGDYFRAKVNKKRLPFNSERMPPLREHKDPKYAKLSIPQFLKKYPEWKV